MSKKDDHYTDVLIEDINDKVQKIMEMLSLMTGMPAEVKRIRTRLEYEQSELKVTKAVVTEHSSQLQNHEKRITTLEAA